jgi:hypothetical protein
MMSVNMTPSERRTACIRLLAHIDQKIERAKSSAMNPLLTDEGRQFAEADVEFQQRMAIHAERVLASAATAVAPLESGSS